MSTRHARTADKASNEKNAKILRLLLQETPNKYCADCKKKDARWASWNLGIFVCIRCSGIHRSLGVHISKDQIDNMVRWGNERANKYWEANLGDRKPSESNMEMWIRAKYEQKRWAMKGPIPDPSTLGSSSNISAKQETSIQPPTKQVEKPKPKQSEFANLDAFLTSPSSSPVVKHQPASAPTSQLQGADFFFGSSESNVQTQQPQPQQQQQQKHNDIKSSILSLYNTIPAAQTPPVQQQQQQFFNGNAQNQLSALNFGYAQPPQTNNNQWGSFASPAPANNNQWGSFTSPAPQNNLPQGGQFFSSNTTPNVTPKEPKKDVFADLLG
ncbi:unnamed protein product [Rhizopus stolonifer]